MKHFVQSTSGLWRIILPAITSVVLVAVVFVAVIFPTFKQTILEQKRESIVHLCQTGYSILEYYYTLESNGTLSQKEAQTQAMDQLRQLRYGKNQREYFWLINTTPRMLMHPYLPELEGHDLTSFTDLHGNPLFVNAVEVAPKDDGGYIQYMWPIPDDETNIQPKLSYVKKFKPWGWIIGTGVYLDEVEQETFLFSRKMITILAEVLLATALLTGWVISQSVQVSRRQKQAEQEREHLLSVEHNQRLQAETLQQVTLALTSQTDTQAVLDEILLQVNRLIPYTMAHIVLLKKDTVEIAAWRNTGTYNSETYIATQTHALQSVSKDLDNAREHKTTVISDTCPPPTWKVFEDTTWIKSHLMVPIYNRKQLLGLIRVDSDTAGQFSNEDADRLLPFSNAAAIALDKARLYEQAIEDAQTKLTLLNEVNHRVKNNLSTIIGLLYARRRRSAGEAQNAYRTIIAELISQVQGLSTIHSMLSSAEWQPLLLHKLVQQIIYSALQSYSNRKPVTTTVTPSDVHVTPNQAHSLAIVLNELVTNTCKHGTSDSTKAQITVTISRQNTGIILQFADNGPGYPPDILEKQKTTVGLYLIENIVQTQLQGTITFANANPGATAAIFFKPDARRPDDL